MLSDLFEVGPQALVEDAEGGVVYRPGFVDAATAARWFGELRAQVPWQAQRRPMYDRVVDDPIALLSLGAARRMVIRARSVPRTARRIELEPGSLLLMSHASQLTHEHAVPKQRAPVGERISLAFRLKPSP